MISWVIACIEEDLVVVVVVDNERQRC